MIAGHRKVSHADVAGCEVVESHPAKFGSGRVRCSGVAPCDLFLNILRNFGDNADLDTNVLEVSGMASGDLPYFSSFYPLFFRRRFGILFGLRQKRGHYSSVGRALPW